jgi:hypothetical protein
MHLCSTLTAVSAPHAVPADNRPSSAAPTCTRGCPRPLVGAVPRRAPERPHHRHSPLDVCCQPFTPSHTADRSLRSPSSPAVATMRTATTLGPSPIREPATLPTGQRHHQRFPLTRAHHHQEALSGEPIKLICSQMVFPRCPLALHTTSAQLAIGMAENGRRRPNPVPWLPYFVMEGPPARVKPAHWLGQS